MQVACISHIQKYDLFICTNANTVKTPHVLSMKDKADLPILMGVYKHSSVILSPADIPLG